MSDSFQEVTLDQVFGGNGPTLPPYQVRPGDTLWDIVSNARGAVHLGTSPQEIQAGVDALAAQNHITNPNKINAGDMLTYTPPVPPAG
jgi:hypothetical protein